MYRHLLLFFLTGSFLYSSAQTVTLSGTVRNTRLEPLALVSVQVRDTKLGTVTATDGSYSISLEAGIYDFIFTMVGYKSQVIQVALKGPAIQNLIMEEEGRSLEEVTIRGKARDRSEEYIRQVIKHKEELLEASGAYSCKAYILAVQEDSAGTHKKKNKSAADSAAAAKEFDRMSMMEVSLQFDRDYNGRIKEERQGVKRRGNPEGLFFLSLTDGDFNLYNNLLRTRISQVPFLSPVSYVGLTAYRYKLTSTTKEGQRKIYTIQFRGRQLSNATVSGELQIVDSLWIIREASLQLPSYHVPGYDKVEVHLHYSYVDSLAWMIDQMRISYSSKHGKGRMSGETSVALNNFRLQRSFPARYFGPEVSATGKEAYERDSSFWLTARLTPLSEKEIRFMRYKDSMQRVTTSQAYLDSVDARVNQITWKKMLLFGQNFFNRKKGRTWNLPPLLGCIDPFNFAGTRLNLYTWYLRQSKLKKTISVYASVNYGLRNQDFNGDLDFRRMYNPFNRAFYRFELKRDFEYIYEGDAWINMLKRTNYYLDNAISAEHGQELANGLFLSGELAIAFRRSVADYKTGTTIDSLIGSILPGDEINNRPPDFEPYNALYGRLRLEYTPAQRYVREPYEKIFLGSKWPTFFAMWRKGIRGPLKSKVDFDYLEFGLEQELRLRTAGTGSYQLKSGSFLSTRHLELVDYQFQRRGDPYLFQNPSRAFQALDSTFPVFHRYYQGHYLHEFNGALLNKIPFLKKLGLREVAGGGFLFAPERDLRYGELFAGIERVFKWPFNPIYRLKFGVYVVGSAANQFNNPVQLKFGIMSWDRKRNRWM